MLRICTRCKSEKSIEDFEFQKPLNKHRTECRVCRSEWNKSWHKRNYEYRKKWIADNKDRVRKWTNDRRKRFRDEATSAYGGKCICCGERNREFLAFDHIWGGGKQHMKSTAKGYHLHEWLRKQGYPKDKFQLLCHNCNSAKGFYGYCPHWFFPRFLNLSVICIDEHF